MLGNYCATDFRLTNSNGLENETTEKHEDTQDVHGKAMPTPQNEDFRRPYEGDRIASVPTPNYILCCCAPYPSPTLTNPMQNPTPINYIDNYLVQCHSMANLNNTTETNPQFQVNPFMQNNLIWQTGYGCFAPMVNSNPYPANPYQHYGAFAPMQCPYTRPTTQLIEPIQNCCLTCQHKSIPYSFSQLQPNQYSCHLENQLCNPRMKDIFDQQLKANMPIINKTTNQVQNSSPMTDINNHSARSHSVQNSYNTTDTNMSVNPSMQNSIASNQQYSHPQNQLCCPFMKEFIDQQLNANKPAKNNILQHTQQCIPINNNVFPLPQSNSNEENYDDCFIILDPRLKQKVINIMKCTS